MGEIPVKSIQSPVTDHVESEATGASRSELTREGSVESGVRVEGFWCESCDLRGNVCGILNDSAGWTNEKHNSYLDYLEESFVKRLHRSSSLFRFQKEGKVYKSCSPHDLQDDNNRSNCGSRRGAKQHTEFVSYRENLIASIAEASGQNFIDEDKEETSSCGPELKKRRRTTIVDDASSSDQVVPFGKKMETSISHRFSGRDGPRFTLLRTDRLCCLKGS